MFLRPLLRIVPDDTRIQFMRGRFLGLLTSAVLSVASAILFFYPGLHLGIDFRGGVVMEVRTPGPADFAGLRTALPVRSARTRAIATARPAPPRNGVTASSGTQTAVSA